MHKNRQKGITKAYRNDKKDVNTRIDIIVISKLAATELHTANVNDNTSST